jgi:hypothetical protein
MLTMVKRGERRRRGGGEEEERRGAGRLEVERRERHLWPLL